MVQEYGCFSFPFSAIAYGGCAGDGSTEGIPNEGVLLSGLEPEGPVAGLEASEIE